MQHPLNEIRCHPYGFAAHVVAAAQQDEDAAVPNAMWIACTAACGGDMQFGPAGYTCVGCGHVEPKAPYAVDALADAEDEGIIGRTRAL